MTTNEIDAKVQKLFERLQTKKREVELLEKTGNYKTNLSFPLDLLRVTRINIHTANVSDITHALAFLISSATAWEEACKVLEVKMDFIWGGYSLAEWKYDMHQRVSRINITDKKKELLDLEKKLNNVVSPEQRRLLEIEAITKALE